MNASLSGLTRKQSGGRSKVSTYIFNDFVAFPWFVKFNNYNNELIINVKQTLNIMKIKIKEVGVSVKVINSKA